MSKAPIRTLLLPNKEHPYGDSLQEALEKVGVTPLKCDAGWGFELHENLNLIFDLDPDILHLQWPESLCRADQAEDLDLLAARIGEALSAIEKKGIRIVWTMHNLYPHILVDLAFQSTMYEHFASHASGVIHHSNWGMREARRTYAYRKGAKHKVLRHGFFTKGIECDLSQSAARAQLRLPTETSVYVYCGAFRKDKNIDILVRALGENGPDSAHLLVMVGAPKETASELYPQLDLDFGNILWPGRLPFEELSVYVAACDALISVHGDKHLTSAGPHLSQSYLKTQVCLSCGYNREVLGESAFYFEPGSDIVENLRSRLRTLTPEMLRRASGGLESARAEYHWDLIGRNTRVFYEEVLGAKEALGG